MKQIAKTVLVTLLMILAFGTISVQAAEKDEKAIGILQTAIDKAGEWTSVSSSVNKIMNYKDDESGEMYNQTLVGLLEADASTIHALLFDGETAWQDYTIESTEYRKYYDETEWTSYTNYNPELYSTPKTKIANLLTEVKGVKISGESKTNYTIKGKSAKKDADWKSVVITVNKKSGLITKIKYNYKTNTRNYLGSESTFTVTGGSMVYSNIAYGDCKVNLPDELVGE